MIKLYSYGKINLFLNIEGRLQNGYHRIKTVMQSIDLHDEIHITELPGNSTVIECSDKFIPTDFRNTCSKAADLIKQQYSIDAGLKIEIKKTIPSGAGLAGGSGNSAAVIKGLDRLWNLKMSEEEMHKIGLKIGADVPFCISGGTYLAEGIGEKLTRLEKFKWDNILIVKPNFSMSTAYVYKNLSPKSYNLYPNNEVLSFIGKHDYNAAANSVVNTLERVVEEMCPEIIGIKKIMKSHNAVSSMMTGSGSAVFGLFQDEANLNNAYDELKKNYIHTYKTVTIDRGIDFCD